MALPATATSITFVLTRDRAVSDAFYGETLGLPFKTDDGYAAVFDLNGAELRITHIPDHVAAPHPVLGWEVADIGATIADLQASGLTMIHYPGMGQDDKGIWTSPDTGSRIAFFADPDGNILTLTQS